MWTPVYFVRQVPLPATIEGVSVPNDDGTFDIYLNGNLCEARQQECLQHEIKHIIDDHFYQENKTVSQLEQEANGTAASAAEEDPPRLLDVFKESPPGTIPFFSSLEAFRNYMFSMREQTQCDMQHRSVG